MTATGRAASEDVEEVDVDKLKKMVHVKDEDIVAADAALVAHEEKSGAER